MGETKIINRLTDYLGYDLETTQHLMRKACNSYRRYFVSKKNGGVRAILHPSAATKSIQYAIMEMILNNLPVHPAAMAYVRGRTSPLLVNAKIHSRFNFSLRIDFKEFFPSIQPNDLFQRIKSVKISTDEAQLLKFALFVPKYMAVRSYTDEETRIRKRFSGDQYGLAIGAPSSPIISNIVMREIDLKLDAFAKKNRAVYTRYADDIIYSSNKKGECGVFLNYLTNLIKNTQSPILTINENKTTFMSRGSRRVVTGLRIKPDKGISLGRDKKRKVRAMLHWMKYGKLDEKGKRYLRGYLSFVMGVEPDFYDRLIMKYGGELVKRAHFG